MNKLRIYVLVLALLLIASIAAPSLFAQQASGGLPLEEELALWDEELNLNASQEDHFAEVISAFNGKVEEIRNSGKRPKRSELIAMMNERDTELKSCLHADQISHYDEIKQDIMKRGRGRS